LRILIADDNQLVRRGIVRLLSGEPSWEVCGEVAHGDEILKTAEDLHPDLVLLDVSMPGLNGLEVARRLRRQLPKVRIVILSHHDPSHLRAVALEAGADACVDKGSIGNDLLPTIRSLF
jgi:DNA-binding NarL/FixJ family response regulator